MRTDTLDLPPLFRLVTLREAGDAFAHAISIASEAGAGTLVWVRRFDMAEFALVLEPEEPLATARRALYAGMNALADAIATDAPPERPLEIVWPVTIRFDTSIVGGGRLAWPGTARENDVPEWLVFGAMVRLHGAAEIMPGVLSPGASLFDTGFDEADAARLIESFSRHFMAHVDSFQRDGFRHVAEHYCARLPHSDERRFRIDSAGDLIERPAGKANPVTRHALREALQQPPAWLDAASGEPVL